MRCDAPAQLGCQRDRVRLLDVEQHQPCSRYEHAENDHFWISGDDHEQGRERQPGERERGPQPEQVRQQRPALGGLGERVFARSDPAQSELGHAGDDHDDRGRRDEATEVGNAEVPRHQGNREAGE